jgi:hypothetical protein
MDIPLAAKELDGVLEKKENFHHARMFLIPQERSLAVYGRWPRIKCCSWRHTIPELAKTKAPDFERQSLCSQIQAPNFGRSLILPNLSATLIFCKNRILCLLSHPLASWIFGFIFIVWQESYACGVLGSVRLHV